ncbi:hypothetical protein D3C71_1304970 [compost metagenome]
MLGHVDHGAAVFPAYRQALDDAQRQQQDPRQVARRFIGGQAADQDGGAAHHHDRDQEGVLAAPLVAQVAEHHGAQGANDETHRQCAQGGQQCHRGVVLRKQHLAHEHRQGPVDEEVVPLEQGAQGGRHDHLTFLFPA